MTAPPPFFAQWESAERVAAFVAGADPATDARWAGSGAADIAEYARWAGHLCGMACLRMALAARGRAMTIHALRRAVQAEGGYVETPEGEIRGLIYAGAVAWLQRQGIAARILLDLTAGEIPALLESGPFIASVHPAIRDPSQAPPSRGGHLVLVFGMEGDRLRFHNPSGLAPDSRLRPACFGRFFAGRGIHLPQDPG